MERLRQYRKAHYANPEIKAAKKAYRQANRRRVSATRARRHRERMASDPVYRAKHNKRQRDRFTKHPLATPIHHARLALNRTIQAIINGKEPRTNELLGCGWEAFKAHMESRFQEGMSWSNRRQWVVDHIIPYAVAATLEDVKGLSYYRNVRPVWPRQNIDKGAKVPPPGEWPQGVASRLSGECVGRAIYMAGGGVVGVGA